MYEEYEHVKHDVVCVVQVVSYVSWKGNGKYYLAIFQASESLPRIIKINTDQHQIGSLWFFKGLA